MKSFLLLLTLVFIGVYIKAQKVEFIEYTSLSNAISEGQKANKPLFFYYYSDYCSVCKKTNKSIWNNKKVADHFNQNFVCIRVNASSENIQDFKAEYEVNSLPTLLITDTSGNVIEKVDGAYAKADSFIWFAEEALKK